MFNPEPVGELAAGQADDTEGADLDDEACLEDEVSLYTEDDLNMEDNVNKSIGCGRKQEKNRVC